MDGRERFSAVKSICAAKMGSKGFDRALTSQFCSTAICAFSITCSPHWHSQVRPVTEHAQTVEVRTGLACVLHPTAGRDHAASARSSRGTQGQHPRRTYAQRAGDRMLAPSRHLERTLRTAPLEVVVRISPTWGCVPDRYRADTALSAQGRRWLAHREILKLSSSRKGRNSLWAC